MTIEEFLRGLEARHPEGYDADDVTEYALEVVTRAENQLHNAQAQITAAREAQKMQNAAGFVNAPGKAKLFYHGENLPVDTKLYTHPAPAAVPTKNQIREVFMRNGFTVKEGQTDLKPYVYDAAYDLLEIYLRLVIRRSNVH